MRTVAVLGVAPKSVYRQLAYVECFDAKRDLRTFLGGMPVVGPRPAVGHTPGPGGMAVRAGKEIHSMTITWISAHDWIAWQTELFIRRFDRSVPSPSGRAMGLSTKDREMSRIVERLGFVPAAFIAGLIKRRLVTIAPRVEMTNWRIHRSKRK